MAELWDDFDSNRSAIQPTAKADLWAEFDASVQTAAAPNALGDDIRTWDDVPVVAALGENAPVGVRMSGNGDIPLNAGDRVAGQIYTDKSGGKRLWDGASWTAPPRETTLGEFAGGLGTSLAKGFIRAPMAIADLAAMVGVPTAQAFSNEARNAIAGFDAITPDAFRQEAQRGIVTRDPVTGEMTGLQMPTAEAVTGLLLESAPQAPMFLGGGGALRGLAAKVLPNAPRLATGIGYGGANAALVAPGQYQDTYAAAKARGMTDEQADSAAAQAALQTAALTSLTGGLGGTLAAGSGAARSLPRALLRGYAADAPFEGIEEAGQSVIGDVALGDDVNIANAIDTGLLAMIAGGLPGAGVAGIEYGTRRAAQPSADAAPAPAPAPAPTPTTEDTTDLDALLRENLTPTIARNLLGDDVADALGIERVETQPDADPDARFRRPESAPAATPSPAVDPPQVTPPEQTLPQLGDDLVAPRTPVQAGQAPAAQSAPVPAGADLSAPLGEAATAAPTGKLYQRGNGRSNTSAQALQAPDGTWHVRSRKAGQWQPWQRRESFDASPTFGYRETATGSGSVNLPGIGRVPVAKAEAQSKREADHNPLLDMIANAGGISRADAARMGVAPAVLNTRRGIKPLYGKAGIPLDNLREMMIAEGYFPQESPDQPSQIGVNEVWELASKALDGEPVGPLGDPRIAEMQMQREADRYGDEETPFDRDADEDELADWFDEVEAQAGESFEPGDEAELASIYELAERAEQEGFAPAQEPGESQGEYAARLWVAVRELEAQRGTDREAEESRVRVGLRARESGQAQPVQGLGGFALEAPTAPRAQEVAPPPSAGLFGAPTARDFIDGASRARDAQRDGKIATGRTDMAAGEGELFAGTRPEQESVPALTPPAADVTEGQPSSAPLESVEQSFEIAQVVAEAMTPGNRQLKTVIRPAQPWLETLAVERAGLDIAGYSHVLDTSAVRHTMKNHGDEAREIKRGQLPVTPADFEALPSVVEAPQKVVFGTRNRTGHDQVGFIKKMPDGTWLYLEEARTGKRELASVTLRKYPATTNAESIVSTLNPNARSDGGNGLIIADGPAQDNDPLESVHDGPSGPIYESGDFAVGVDSNSDVQQAAELSDTDLTQPEREAFTRQRTEDGENEAERELAAQMSREEGEADADRYGLREAVSKVLAGAKGAPTVEFVRDLDGITGLANLPAANGRKVRTAALYSPKDKRVFIITGVVKDPVRAAWHAAHEIAGHHGLRALLGDQLNPALEIALQNPTVAKLADAIGAERKSGDRLLMAEEALAELAAAVRTGNYDHITDRYSVAVPEGIRARVVAAIENFLKRLKALFGKKGVTFTDEQVRELLEAAWQAVDGESSAVSDSAALESVDGSKAAHRRFLDGPAVVALTGNEFASDGVPLTDKVPKWYAEQGKSVVQVDGVGAVLLDARAVKDSISHGLGRDKVAAFAAVPDVLERGQLIHSEPMTGSREGGTVHYVAAPVRLGDKDMIEVVLVKSDPRSRRMYVHEVALREKLQQSAFKTGAGAAEAGARTGADAGAVSSVLQSIYEVNPGNDSMMESVSSDDGDRLPGAGPRLAADDVRRADRKEAADRGIIERAKQDVADQIEGLRKGKNRPNNPKSLLQHANDVRGFLFDSVVSRMRDLEARNPKSKSLRTLFNHVVTAPGDSRLVVETLHGEADSEFAKFTNRVRNILSNEGMERLTDRQNDQLRKTMLGTMTNAPPAIQRAAKRIRTLMDKRHEDLLAAGVEVGEVEDVGYLTRMYDDAKILTDEAGFLAAAGEYYRNEGFNIDVGNTGRDTMYGEGNLARFLSHAKRAAMTDPMVADTLAKIREAVKHYRYSSNTNDEAADIRRLVESIRAAVADNYGHVSAAAWLHKIKTPTVNEVFNGVGPSGAPLTKERVLGGTADTILTDYLKTDMLDILDNYARVSSKKIAMATRFGPKGEKVQALLDSASREGVPKHDMDAAVELMESALGSYNPINQGVKSTLDGLQAVTYLALLSRTAFSSAPEGITFAIRTGNLVHTIAPLIQLGRALSGSQYAKDLNDMALLIGLNGNKAMNEVMQNQLGGDYGMEPNWSATVQRFMTANLLMPLTRAQRAYGVGAATGYLRWIAKHVAEGTRTAEMAVYLNELGIADHEAFAQWMAAQAALPEPTELHDADGRPTPRGRDYMTAVRRLTDQTIQNPNASQRPVWMNNPFGRVVGSIMGFSYASYDNVIRREITLSETLRREAGIGAQARRLATATAGATALSIGVILTTIVREALFNAARFEDKDDDEIAKEMVALGLSRTFGLGTADPLIQFATGLKYQKGMAETMLGASMGGLAELVDSVAGLATSRNSKATETAEFRAMEQVYSKIITPAANAVLSRIPLAGTAGILAVSDKRMREGFAGLFFERPEKETALDRKHKAAIKDLETVSDTVKDRLQMKPKDQWAAELEGLKKEYAPLLNGVELDTYVDNTRNRNAGKTGPKVSKEGEPRLRLEAIDKGDTAGSVLGELEGYPQWYNEGGKNRQSQGEGSQDRIKAINKAIKLVSGGQDLTREALVKATEKLQLQLPSAMALYDDVQAKGDGKKLAGSRIERKTVEELQFLRRAEKRAAVAITKLAEQGKPIQRGAIAAMVQKDLEKRDEELGL